MRKIAQLPLPSYLFKYAQHMPYYKSEVFRLPFYFPMTITTNYKQVRAYFSKITEDDSHKTLLVDMFRVSPARLYALKNWLNNDFKNEMFKLLIAGRAYQKMDKEVILQYLDTFYIEESEFSYERAAKAWTRHKQMLMKSGKSALINFDYGKLRKAPKRKSGGDLPSIDIQDL